MARIANQTWEVERYATAGAFVPVLGVPVVDLLAPQRGERILDLGCGDGVLSEKIAAAGAEVVAVDAAPDLIEETDPAASTFGDPEALRQAVKSLPAGQTAVTTIVLYGTGVAEPLDTSV